MLLCISLHISYMHVTLGRYIRSIFMYLEHMSPQWSVRERLFLMSFDEMYIDTACDIDRLLDLPVNPNNHKNAQIVMCKQIAGKGQWPYYIDTNYALTPGDIVESNLRFDECGITLLAVVCDQGTY